MRRKQSRKEKSLIYYCKLKEGFVSLFVFVVVTKLDQLRSFLNSLRISTNSYNKKV
jgi:hypothetical protein